MKKLLFVIGTLCAVLISSCTGQSDNTQYTYLIPDSLIIDAATATIIPDYQKKIGDTKVICYIVDTISGKYNGEKVSVELYEVGNPIETYKTVYVERDSFVVDFPDMVGTSRCLCAIELDTLFVGFSIYIEPCKTNKVWIMPNHFGDNIHNIYSDNIYNSINHAIVFEGDRFFP